MQKLKTIRSHVGHGRWLAECELEAHSDLAAIVGYLPRHRLPAESRYFYSPAHAVYSWRGLYAMSLEVAHKVYEIWEIDASEIYETEERATDEYLASLRALPVSGRIRHLGQA
jgi:hypothetical protein